MGDFWYYQAGSDNGKRQRVEPGEQPWCPEPVSTAELFSYPYYDGGRTALSDSSNYENAELLCFDDMVDSEGFSWPWPAETNMNSLQGPFFTQDDAFNFTNGLNDEKNSDARTFLPQYSQSSLPEYNSPELGEADSCETSKTHAPAITVPQEIADITCFGMIADIPVQCHDSDSLALESTSLPLIFTPPETLKFTDSGREIMFGNMEKRAAKILISLMTEVGIEFQIYSRSIRSKLTCRGKLSAKARQNMSQSLVNVIIYGPIELCEPVGDYLIQCGIPLQDPVQADRDVIYKNPQILSRTDEPILISSLMIESLSVEVKTYNASADLFAKLSCDDHLASTEAPDAINKPLYPHQKKALTFMLQREQAWNFESSEEGLWIKELDETGRIVYTNMITNKSENEMPRESRGGLLADQMGLGKSLTMISLIALNPATNKEPVIFTSCGPPMRRIKSTLVVVPYSLLGTWDNQLGRHLKPGSISWIRFHGSQTRKVLSLGSYDIVITTFETLVRQQKKHMDPKYIEDTLFSFWWHRIVLDEGKLYALSGRLSLIRIAHTIRNRATSMAQACCTIFATNRWSMTGTPIQNRATDFGSLLEFLQIYPFSNHKIFDKEIIRPWLKSEEHDASRIRKLVNNISLARTKAVINLPKRHDETRFLNFSSVEQEYYDKIKTGTKERLKEARTQNPLTTGLFLNALQWLNELRLICNHGITHSRKVLNNTLITNMQHDQPWTKKNAEKAFETLANAGEALCQVCLACIVEGTGEAANSDLPKPSLSRCLTLVCGSCIQNGPGGKKVPTCSCSPKCPKFEVSWAPEVAKRVPESCLPSLKEGEVPTKLKALLESLQSCAAGEKSVVFSYWTFTLDLVESLLRDASITYTRIDGNDSGKRREQAMQKFQTDECIQVILVSITCGGAGLDLTAASCAYLLEPQWNPMIEEQALCRIHRLGQTKEVRTIRFLIRGSFEEKVVDAQNMKKDIAAWAFSEEERAEAVDMSNRLLSLGAEFG